ncbi:MAG TPA: MAPEG family protein [Xanthobacteraceae bacterium]|nr:MAPEG family protein [Xanthobacteraceae bacterium]
MSIQAILLPLFVQVALTFFLLFWTGRARVAAVRRGDVHPRDIALREQNWPKQETQIANAYHNQLELPVLFYVLTILAIITRHADLLFVLLAWLFVVLRLVHAYIHLTSNRLGRRFAVFAAGFLVLLVMWVIFAVQLLLGV